MKAIKYILSTVLLIAIVWSCSKVEDNFDFVSSVKAPANITAQYSITQDNSGLVTITPNGDGAISYDVTFGDNTADPASVKQGLSVKHTYDEGNYDVKIAGIGITGLKTEMTQALVVSFKAPENLVVVIENDLAISKKVNVTANAVFATFFDVYFGEVIDETPVSANIGETASYVYQEAGTYSIRVVAKGGAIATTEYTEEFEVTAIMQPLASAAVPPSRQSVDVISIYSSVYSDIVGTNYNPDWGQSGQGSSFAEFDLNGDKMLQYINLSYQGVGIGETIDVSAMEFLHMDVWTADVTRIETSLINGVDGNSTEAPVWSDLTADEWTSIDIPISDYTDQGLTVDQIFQLKFVGDPWAGGTVFIDNIYFHKAPSELAKLPITFDSEVHTFTPFLDAEFALSVDPDDASNPVGMITNHGQGWGWEGISLALDEWVDFSVNNTITMDFYTATLPHKVLMKFEDTTSPLDGNNNPTVFEEVEVDVLATGWSELSFTYSSTNPYNQIVIFVDGNVYDITGTYYIDNIEQVGASTGSDVTPISFETGFEMSSFDGGDISLVINPDATGNTSDMVLQLVKGDGQVWAGSKLTVPTPFSLSNTTVTAKVWSPRAGLNLLMKYEDATAWPNTVASAEVVATTTVANQWEDLTFDFAGIDAAVDFVNLVLIMDNGTVGDGSADYTIYVDDISADASFDFEIGKAMSSFDGGQISVVTNPDATGNTSALVAKLVKGAGQTWAGSKITSDTPFSFASTTVTVQVYSPRVGLELLMKFEDITPWPNTVATAEVLATTTVANQWEELTFDFSGIDTTVDFLNLVLIMDNGTAGDGSADYTLYIDDIAQN
jgi:hypothetical protein